MVPRPEKAVRVIGFDDAPFARSDAEVNIAGVVCSNTRFEGMLWGTVGRDGLDATEVIIAMLRRSKYHPQLHAVLLDGIAGGGLNVVDLPLLSQELALPCIAVMRKEPDLEAMIAVVKRLPHADQREMDDALAGVLVRKQSDLWRRCHHTPAD